ncbi:MAG: T9SS type A sorting domain-containing protein [Bacteroidetes bacterium]|nr:T9SS type A sorting domain-containing protein [Bacteroidota bacterium]
MKKQLLLSLFSFGALQASSQQWWPQNSMSQNDFNTIYAASSSTVYMYGDSSDIFGGFVYGSQFKTVTQGSDWSFLSMGSPVYLSKGSFFVSTAIGYLAGENAMSGNGFILKTINGGNTWVESTPFPERFEDIKFVTPTIGYACGRNDYVVRTTDGGTSWVDISASTGDHLRGVHFTTPANGYIAGRAGNIAHSSDSGNTWVNQTSNTPEDLESIWFINDSTGWAVGKAGAIVFTNDWGLNWNVQTSNTPEDLFDVEFVNDTMGWAVGTAGTVIKTIDAGVTWAPETSGTPEDIFSITMINEELGWFCGAAGVVFVYGIAPPPPPNGLTENSDNLNVAVSPNPFVENVTVYLPVNGTYSFTLTDIEGRVIESWNSQNISQLVLNTEIWANGIYLLKISDENANSVTKKLVKK